MNLINTVYAPHYSRYMYYNILNSHVNLIIYFQHSLEFKIFLITPSFIYIFRKSLILRGFVKNISILILSHHKLELHFFVDNSSFNRPIPYV